MTDADMTGPPAERQAANAHAADAEPAGIASPGPASPAAGADARWAGLFDVWRNPITLAHARLRMRTGPLLGWAVVTVSVVAFIFLMVYLTLTFRGEWDPVAAAKASLLPLIVVQGVLLMGLGTAAVSGGIAKEKADGVLDYHRMSPQPPTRKIVGYLFGLPSREYALFGLTLPFVAWAVWRGGLDAGKVIQFYVVFLSSVWLYHLLGLMLGINRKRAKGAGAASGVVLMLYLLVPVLSRMGLGFLDFLTVRPTFYGLVAGELAGGGALADRFAFTDRYAAVDFFNLTLNPTLFTLLVQGLGIAALYHVVRRRFIDPGWHAVSKPFAVGFYGAAMVLLCGSLWPQVQGRAVYDTYTVQALVQDDAAAVVVSGAVFAFVAGTLALFLTVLVTPSDVTTRRGVRRALRRAGSVAHRAADRVPHTSDAASGWATAAGLLGLIAGGAILLIVATQQGERQPPGPAVWPWTGVLFALVGAVLLTVQAVRERLGAGLTTLLLFVVWALPFMVAALLMTAFDRPAAALYAAVPCAPLQMVTGLLELGAAYRGEGDGFSAAELLAEVEAARPALLASVGLYGSPAVAAQTWRWRGRRRIERAEAVRAGAGPAR